MKTFLGTVGSIALLLVLTGCGVDHSSQLFDPNDPSKGELTWEKTEWKLQCPSPTDFAYVGGTSGYTNENLDDIRSNESARCSDLALVINTPSPFTEEAANAEVDAYLKAMPKDKPCEQFIKYRLAASAVTSLDETLAQIESNLELLQAAGDFTGRIGLYQDKNAATRERGLALYYLYSNDFDIASIKSNKSLAAKCNFTAGDLYQS